MNNIYAQLIDDLKGETIVAASSLEKSVKDKVESPGSIEAAVIVGKMIAERATEKGITEVTLRSWWLYFSWSRQIFG